MAGDTRGLGRSNHRVSSAADGGAGVTFGALALTLSGCSWQECSGWAGLKGITPESHANRDLWLGSVIAFVVGIIVWALMFWSAAFHRKKKGDDEMPRQFGYNMPLELC